MEQVTPIKDSKAGKKEQVQEMFDDISGRYDFLNRFLSVGIDTIWRKKAINELKPIAPKQILDIATGTGDLAIEALRLNPDKVTGIDISEGMLEVGRVKIKNKKLEDKIVLQSGDSENIDFEDNTFDAITVAFGVRNFETLTKGIGEMHRVMRPGGKVVVLEFSKPKKFPVKQLYNFYFKYILPVLGKSISKNSRAYSYLPESVNAFPEGNEFVKILEEKGFKNTTCQPLTFGICSIYTGIKQ